MHIYTYILYIVIHLIEKKEEMGHRGDDIWSDLGIGSPYKVYLGSTIRGVDLVLSNRFLYSDRFSLSKSSNLINLNDAELIQ